MTATASLPMRVTRRVCPVCRRDVAVVSAARPVFRPHADGINRPCLMAGEPIPAAEAWE